MISSWLNRSHKNQCHQFGTPNNISATLSGVALFVVDEDKPFFNRCSRWFNKYFVTLQIIEL